MVNAAFRETAAATDKAFSGAFGKIAADAYVALGDNGVS